MEVNKIMICEKCGYSCTPDMKFCLACGSSIKTPPAPTSATPPQQTNSNQTTNTQPITPSDDPFSPSAPQTNNPSSGFSGQPHSNPWQTPSTSTPQQNNQWQQSQWGNSSGNANNPSSSTGIAVAGFIMGIIGIVMGVLHWTLLIPFIHMIALGLGIPALILGIRGAKRKSKIVISVFAIILGAISLLLGAGAFLVGCFSVLL